MKLNKLNVLKDAEIEKLKANIAGVIQEAMFDSRNNPDKFDTDTISYDYAEKVMYIFKKFNCYIEEKDKYETA